MVLSIITRIYCDFKRARLEDPENELLLLLRLVIVKELSSPPSEVPSQVGGGFGKGRTRGKFRGVGYQFAFGGHESILAQKGEEIEGSNGNCRNEGRSTGIGIVNGIA